MKLKQRKYLLLKNLKENEVEKRKMIHDEIIDDSELLTNQYFKTKTFNIIILRLSEELKKRLEAYELIYKNFEFLSNLPIYQPKQILENAENLYRIYKNDLDECFMEECVHLASYLKSNEISENSILELSKLIYRKKIEILFPKLNKNFRIFYVHI